MSAVDKALWELEALVSPTGQKLLDRLARVEVTPETELGVGVLLRREYPGELVTTALGQHKLRCRAQAKFTRAQRMYFTRAGLEQATSEVIARHRATRFDGAASVGISSPWQTGGKSSRRRQRATAVVVVGLVDRVEAVGIKAAPGIARDEIPAGWEVEFIADQRDLKEAALWSPALAAGTSRGHDPTGRPRAVTPTRSRGGAPRSWRIPA